MNKLTSKNKIFPVILAGGSGSRLWPVSRTEHPKQFHYFMGNRSLFQLCIRRVSCQVTYEKPIIVTTDQYHSIVSRQLAELGDSDATIVLEPDGKNTAPAIALAALYVKNSLGIGENGYLLVMPSDHMIRDDEAFQTSVKVALNCAAKNDHLVALGVQPKGINTGYGYARVGRSLGDRSFKIDSFIEKPNECRAKELLNSGRYVWNSGIFLFPVSRFLSELESHYPDIFEPCTDAVSGAELEEDVIRPDEFSYRSAPSISVDYAVMEKTDFAAITITDPDWSDIGNWSAWWEFKNKDQSQNVLEGNVLALDCKSSLIQSDGPLVTALGVHGFAVVANKDAVLVLPLSRAQEVKDVTQLLTDMDMPESVRHAWEDRPWGNFQNLEEGDGFKVKHISVKPGKSLSKQYHCHRSEHWTVVSGIADVYLDGEVTRLHANESIYIPQGSVHRITNCELEAVELVEVQVGSYLGEDDIFRIEDEYGRAEKGGSARVSAVSNQLT